MSNATPMERLRAETAPHHTKTEQNPLLVKVTNPDLTLADYSLIIRGFRAFTDHIERHYAAWQELIPGLSLDERRKLHMLDTDLAYLGSKLGTSFSDLTVSNAPSAQNLECVLGTLYVLEGSTLGGRIILKSLEKHLGLGPDSGACFYEGYGDRTGPMWKSFGAYVNGLDLSAESTDLVVEYAKRCFNDLDVFFEQIYQAHS